MEAVQGGYPAKRAKAGGFLSFLLLVILGWAGLSSKEPLLKDGFLETR